MGRHFRADGMNAPTSSPSAVLNISYEALRDAFSCHALARISRHISFRTTSRTKVALFIRRHSWRTFSRLLPLYLPEFLAITFALISRYSSPLRRRFDYIKKI